MFHGHKLEGDALAFLSVLESGIEAHLKKELIRQHGLKYSKVLMVELGTFGRTTDNVYDGNAASGTVTMTAYFRSNAASILNVVDIEGVVREVKTEVLRNIPTRGQGVE